MKKTILTGLSAGVFCALVPMLAVADDATLVQTRIAEAASIHTFATAARLCGSISERELVLAQNRMDRIHAVDMSAGQRETYLVLRASNSFKETVLARAVEHVRRGCGQDLAETWRDLSVSLAQADVPASTTVALRAE
ncbi:hypothetical protein IP84_08945 [beta proteobacterium AAP99]|nr:hypothetical protein IP84_08945 [beta proteobacterium AAP99]